VKRILNKEPYSMFNIDMKKVLKKKEKEKIHKTNGRIVVTFWDEEYLKNYPNKDGRKKN
jgi:hypothetical protein